MSEAPQAHVCAASQRRGDAPRQSLRMLDDLRVRHGRLDAPVPVGEAGGTLHVELNHSDPSVLPAGFRNDSNDSRIMVVALNLRAEGRDVCLVPKDSKADGPVSMRAFWAAGSSSDSD